jgi:hypothetical protein
LLSASFERDAIDIDEALSILTRLTDGHDS